jgi:hypothetical protein
MSSDAILASCGALCPHRLFQQALYVLPIAKIKSPYQDAERLDTGFINPFGMN